MEHDADFAADDTLVVDRQAIQDIEDRFNRAWNAHRPLEMIESLSKDAQFVTVNGVWVKGRSAFKELLERLHGGPLKETRRETLEMQIRFLSPDVAIAHSRFRISGDVNDNGKPIPPREGVGIRVVHKQDGGWITVAVQNTDILNRRH
jgi:uncharacterized protein (TIGR02246 family)